MRGALIRVELESVVVVVVVVVVVERKQSTTWSSAFVDEESGLGAGRERLARRTLAGCLDRFASSMDTDSVAGSLRF